MTRHLSMTKRCIRPTPGWFVVILAIGCQEHGVTAFNSEPVANITSHSDGDSMVEGQPNSFSGTVTDDDDTSKELTATWSIGDRIVCENLSPESNGKTQCDIALEAEDILGETVSVALTVHDPKNASHSKVVELIPEPNTEPTVAIDAPVEDGRYYADLALTLEGRVQDAEDSLGELVIWWESSLEGDLPIESLVEGDGSIRATTFLVEGNHTLTLRAKDTGGRTGSDSRNFYVGGPNQSPSCSITAPEDESVSDLESEVTVSGIATDPDIGSEELAVSWESDRDGILNSTSPSADGVLAFTTAELSPGTHVLTLNVEDEIGANCSTSVTHSVRSPPTIESSTPDDGTVVTQGDPVTFVVMVSDPEDSPEAITVSWESDVDDGGVLHSTLAATTGLAQFTAEGLTPGTHAITVTAEDSDGMESSLTQGLVVNQPPTEPEVSVGPDPATTSEDLTTTIEIESFDPEGSPVSYTYAWSVDGALSLSSTSDLLPAAATRKGQTWTISVTPNDGHTDGPAADASVIIQNTPPTLTAATLTPDPPSTTATLTCSPSGEADVDADAVDFTYAWEVNGSGLTEIDPTLAADHFSAGDSVGCAITPWDDETAGEDVAATPVTVNSLPLVHDVTLTPDEPTVLDTLTCVPGVISDPDGTAGITTITHWFINEIDVGVFTDTLESDWFERDDTVRCTVEANDGIESGEATSSDTVEIGNATPEVISVSLSPSTATTHTLLTATVSADDPDGDDLTLNYDWIVAGVSVGTGTDTLDGSTWFERDQSVMVTVTASDDVLTSPPMSSSTIIVENTTPTAPGVLITPSDPAAGKDNLICSISEPSTDDDEDPLTYTLSWTVDGVAFGGAVTTTVSDDTIAAEETSDGETWECTAIANDGTDDSAPSTSSVVPEWRYTGWGDDPVSMTEVGAHLFGTENTDFAGHSLANAGDIDGDGQPDLLVGSYGNDDVESGSGKAYLVTAEHYLTSGSVLLDESHRVYLGSTNGDKLGWALAGGGHIGGDATPDIAIGAYAYEEDGDTENEGVVAVYFDGGPSTASPLTIEDADLRLHGATNGEWAGYGVRFMDDMDGDGNNELLVGAPRRNGVGVYAGAAYIVESSELTGISDYDLGDAVRLAGEAGLDHAGELVAPAGDVDGDGIPDILVGAPLNDGEGLSAGRVYLVLGDSLGLSVTFVLADADIRFLSEGAGDEVGRGLDGNLDVDGDGASDVVIGAPYNNTTASDGGRAYLWLGDELGLAETVNLSEANAIFETSEGDAWFGYSVAHAGDVDNDDLSDIIIGAPHADTSSANAGVAYLFRGADLTVDGVFDVSEAEASFEESGSNYYAGTTAIGIGDVNGDTFDDLAIGVPEDDTMAPRAGAVHVLLSP